jgi:hypothetical protein
MVVENNFSTERTPGWRIRIPLISLSSSHPPWWLGAAKVAPPPLPLAASVANRAGGVSKWFQRLVYPANRNRRPVSTLAKDSAFMFNDWSVWWKVVPKRLHSEYLPERIGESYEQVKTAVLRAENPARRLRRVKHHYERLYSCNK